jgi:hypothetical protein
MAEKVVLGKKFVVHISDLEEVVDLLVADGRAAV